RTWRIFYRRAQHSCGFHGVFGQSETALGAGRLDAFEQELEPGPVHLTRADLRPVRHEATLLEALGPHAESGAVPVQHLHLRATPVDEHEQLARQRIAAARLARERVQAVEGFAHVDRAAIDMDPDRA